MITLQFSRFLTLVFISAFLALAHATPKSGSITGVVAGIADGDTIYMWVDGKKVKMRLAQIDAPEKMQPFGNKAEQSLHRLVRGKEVNATWTKLDGYKRPLITLHADGISVNEALVKQGMAWAYTEYLKDRQLLTLQKQAKEARIGLWTEDNPIPPWEWRKHQKSIHLVDW
jgi:micrococcal nuclease